MAPYFSDFTVYFQQYGIMDFLLPFLLIFTLVFAILQRAKILGENKNFNIIVSLVLALLFIVPHMTGSYPLGYDPVQVLNEALPSVSLVAVAAVMLLLLLGIFGRGIGEALMPVIAIAAILFVIYIFGTTSALNLWRGPSDIFYWWTPQLTELLLIILVFGLIVWFITKEPGQGSTWGKMGDLLGKLTENLTKK